MSDTPIISVITATRNRPTVLARALAGVAAQSFQDYELLIVDDGSPQEVIEAYGTILEPFGGRARVIVKDPLHDKSGSPAIARNRGIRHAKGKWIAFIDDDDYWVDPEHLSLSVAALEAEEADFLFANMYCERLGTVEIPDSYPGAVQLTYGRPLDKSLEIYPVHLHALTSTLRHHCIHPNVMVVRRTLLNSLGGFCERVVFCEDYELAMRLVDAARKVLFRSQFVAAYTLPEPGSHSLRVSPLDQILDRLTATINIRAKCKTGSVRICARQRESWALRELANAMHADHNFIASIAFAWQAVCQYPSLGSLNAFRQSILAMCFAGSTAHATKGA